METIRTPSRLHLSLIDMNGGLGRVDGGIGIALKEPSFEITFEKAASVSGVEGEAREIAERVCAQIGIPGARVGINSSIPDHVGFGSKTQLSLGIAAGVCRAYGIQMPVKQLAKMVGRGGTSGIGVAAFEHGGFILDGGHPAKKGFVPSRFSKEPPAPLLARYDFPWHIVCAWPEGKGAHGEMEKTFFDKYCPIPAGDVEKVSRIILMKLLPSLIEKDLENFGEGVSLLQKTGFKKIEVGLQKPVVRKLLVTLQKNSAGGGMSSFGPVCFGLCGSESEARSLERKVKGEFEVNTIMTRANNEGAKFV
jgi:beta-ribofuranosylaminobenzene 5'-phosphate synthase